MPRRSATTTQSNVARAIRAAQQTGAGPVVVHADGRIEVMVESEPTPVADRNPNEVDQWFDKNAR
jgi:hypothetical protein